MWVHEPEDCGAVLIWQGRGVVAFIVPFFLLFGIQLFFVQVLSRQAYEDHVSGLVAIALVTSAVVVRFLARRWADPGRVFIDKATGQEFSFRRTDALFFVDLGRWPVILAGLAAFSVIYGLIARTL